LKSGGLKPSSLIEVYAYEYIKYIELFLKRQNTHQYQQVKKEKKKTTHQYQQTTGNPIGSFTAVY